MAEKHVFPAQYRTMEIILGVVLIAVGGFLVWDCFDNSGHKLPWPLSGLAFW